MADGDNAESELDIEKLESMLDDAGNPELAMDGEALEIPPELEDLLSSILQDLDSIPDDWLDQDGSDQYDPEGSQTPSGENNSRFAHDADTLYYDEWDFRRQTYRKNWCALKEHDTHPMYDDFA